MHFPKFKSSAFVIGTAILVEASCSPCPFDITPIVTGTILIGKPLKPIPVPGGVRISMFRLIPDPPDLIDREQ
jgi:hypothetical protein